MHVYTKYGNPKSRKVFLHINIIEYIQYDCLGTLEDKWINYNNVQRTYIL